MEYQTQNRSFKEQGVFSNKSIHLGPIGSTLFAIPNDPFVPVFSHQELVPDEEMANILLTCQTKKIYWNLNRKYYQDFNLWTVVDGITLIVCTSIFVSLITIIPDTSWST